MTRIILILFTFLIFVFNSISQTDLVKAEIKLDEIFKTIRQKDIPIDELFDQNRAFIQELTNVLQIPGAMEYPFDSLKTMGKLISPDKEFRLFNWNIELKSGSHLFYCLILKQDGTVIELKDRHKQNQDAEYKTLDQKEWYGALYYEIIPMGRKTYTLLGWNGKTSITTQKLIDVLVFSGKNKVKFGAPIFLFFDSEGRKTDTKKRVVFEYSDDAYMSMKLHDSKKKKSIVYDHLSPNTPNMEGHYQFYYPDFSYDAFELTGSKWHHKSDIYTKNKQSKRDKLYNDPNKGSANPVER